MCVVESSLLFCMWQLYFPFVILLAFIQDLILTVFMLLVQVWNMQLYFVFHIEVAAAFEKESLTTVVFLPSFTLSFLQ